MSKVIKKEDIIMKLNETKLDLDYYIDTQFDLADSKEAEANSKESAEKSRLINAKNKILKRINLIVSWFAQWLEFIKYEKHFNPNNLKRYLYGEIIYVDLGFNVGKEFGGPHYAIVLNKKDTKSNNVLTIVPLSSLKDKNKDKLGDRLYLGNEVKKAVGDNLSNNLNKLKAKIDVAIKELASNKNINQEVFLSKIEYYKKQIEHNQLVHKLHEKLKEESIALTNQITTISKMRIRNPKSPSDSLANIRISKDTMKTIVQKIHKLYG